MYKYNIHVFNVGIYSHYYYFEICLGLGFQETLENLLTRRFKSLEFYKIQHFLAEETVLYLN